jgi:hypothetical protein
MEVEKLNAISDRAAAGGSAGRTAMPRRLPAHRALGRRLDLPLVAGGDWKMFTAEEMAALVRITRSGEGKEEIARRLRAWLARERKDVFLDLGLDGPSIGMAKDISQTSSSRPFRRARKLLSSVVSVIMMVIFL